MNGRVIPSNDEPPPSAAKAISSTTTRPARVSGLGSARGVRNANWSPEIRDLSGGADFGWDKHPKILDRSQNRASRLSPESAYIVIPLKGGSTDTPTQILVEH